MSYEELKNKRGRAKSTITRVTNWVKDNEDIETNLYTFIAKEELLRSAFTKYSDLQDEIESILASENKSDSDKEDSSIIESNYCNSVAKIKECIARLSSVNSVNSVSNVQPQPVMTTQVKLPEVQIKPFRGDLLEYKSFIQLFEAVIINNHTLSDVQKFMYLKSFLRDEPLKLIDNLQVINQNFETALNILADRYNNKISVINAHFKALFDPPHLTKNQNSNLPEFISNNKKLLESLKNLGYTESQLYEFLIIYLFEKQLDPSTKRFYEQSKNLGDLPTLDHFFKFLEKRREVNENLSYVDNTIQRKNTRASFHVGNDSLPSSSHNYNCICCKESHKIYQCNKFKSFNLQDKQSFVKAHQLCFNCLGTKHRVTDCKSNGCSVCHKKHHTLLHKSLDNPLSSSSKPQSFFAQQTPINQSLLNPQPSNNNSNTQSQISPQNDTKIALTTPDQGQIKKDDPIQQTLSMSAISTKNTMVLLSTAVVTVQNSLGHLVKLRALLDNGSQNSIITKAAVEKLGHPLYDNPLQISGVSFSKIQSNKKVDLVIRSNFDTSYTFAISCAVLPNITYNLPQVKINMNKLNIPKNIILADPEFGIPAPVDLLIGADGYYDILCPELIQLGKNLPVLQGTKLGYVIAGRVPESLTSTFLNILPNHTSNSSAPNNIPSNQSFFIQSESESLESLMTKFWHTEELPQNVILTPESELAENVFLNTTKILTDGSYQVNLPLKTKNENHKLGDSFYIAQKRFLNLENRFQKDPNLKKDYTKFIDDYLDMGHAKYVPLNLTQTDEHQTCNKYFLPHHAVIREESTSTKLRVVFDGSCKSSSGYSLNDVTLKGYQVQPNLFDILIRFRIFMYVLTADIIKMFRQIKINPDQRFLLNILWRKDPKDPLKCIQLSTVTYGTNCAPFLATRVLKDLAEKKGIQYPLAAEAILSQTYMDDILGGSNDYESLNQLYFELKNLLNSAGFSLHKWCSNSKDFLQKNSTEPSPEHDFSYDTCSNKILGLKWSPYLDSFMVSVPQNTMPETPTKRKILSIVSQIFDPLGFIAPTVIIGKLIIQKLWLLKSDWDSEITDTKILARWNGFIKTFDSLKQIQIPRYLFLNKSIAFIEIHGFADASLSAYAAAVYVRTVYTDHTVSCYLVCSKSRVAPIKTVTLPRLELSAMLLLSRLVKELIVIFNKGFEIKTVNMWTDSEIALYWINSHPSRWSIYVSNRVSQIQELTHTFSWRHVQSSDNPADLPSRGVLPQDLLHSRLWFHGPTFLSDPNLDLKTYDFVCQKDKSNLPEQKKVTLISSQIHSQHEFWNNIFKRYSTFSHLQRVTAFILRFIYNCKTKNRDKLTGPLSVDELRKSLYFIIKTIQETEFSKEIIELKNNKQLSNKTLLSLKPYLDNEGMIRVGGRLINASIPFEQKHPLLLPSQNYVVSLLFNLEHLRLGHAGPQTVLSNIRLRFWPLNGIRQVKGVINKSIVFFRFKAQPIQQLMSDLPKDRVQLSRPFTKVGVDYGGPFLLKSSNLRKAPVSKAYLALFVCMSSKAVHLELVSSLSSEAFLQTLTRFISRRGNPSVIYSDNATNFLGASNNLKELHDFFKKQESFTKFKEYLSQNEIEFKFIPPRSPHWGGLWESAIKSAKYHIKRLIGETSLTFEEFNTVLTKIEAVMNSRPLCALSSNPNDLSSLTPGHFLIGKSLTALPEKDVSQTPVNRLSLWKQCSQIYQLFWKRWSVEYLNRLQNLPKWYKSSKNIKINDLVLVKDDDTIPLKWPLARVLEIYPGSDNKVRVVKVKTSNGVYTRSIAKLCPLPINDIDIENDETMTL